MSQAEAFGQMPLVPEVGSLCSAFMVALGFLMITSAHWGAWVTPDQLFSMTNWGVGVRRGQTMRRYGRWNEP